MHCCQTVGQIKMKLGIQVGLAVWPWLYCVRWGPRSPLHQRGTAPQFSAHICCGQMAAWIKMSLGMELGLGLVNFVLDGDPSPSPKGVEPAKFSAHVYCGQTAGWAKLVLDTQVCLSTGDCVRWGPRLPAQNGAEPPANFRPISFVAKRLDASRCHLVWM